jgi:hypothetical protein
MDHCRAFRSQRLGMDGGFVGSSESGRGVSVIVRGTGRCLDFHGVGGLLSVCWGWRQWGARQLAARPGLWLSALPAPRSAPILLLGNQRGPLLCLFCYLLLGLRRGLLRSQLHSLVLGQLHGVLLGLGHGLLNGLLLGLLLSLLCGKLLGLCCDLLCGLMRGLLCGLWCVLVVDFVGRPAAQLAEDLLCAWREGWQQGEWGRGAPGRSTWVRPGAMWLGVGSPYRCADCGGGCEGCAGVRAPVLVARDRSGVVGWERCAVR